METIHGEISVDQALQNLFAALSNPGRAMHGMNWYRMEHLKGWCYHDLKILSRWSDFKRQNAGDIANFLEYELRKCSDTELLISEYPAIRDFGARRINENID